VALGILSAAATVAQMLFLSHIIDRVFLKGAALADVRGPLVLLLGAVLARAPRCCGRGRWSLATGRCV
jgi:ABC-type transport system involved in cytochrome bd biosynthesis fused ATPase/permease subunit